MSLHPPPREDAEGLLRQQVSTLIVQSLHEYSGRGPTKAQTAIGKNSVHCILGDTLTTAERTLVEAGYEEDVLGARRRLQEAMRPHLVTEVEKLTGRKVVAFMSDNHIDPDIAVETFVFEPEQGDGAIPPAV